MKILISDHAKDRMNTYGIEETLVVATLNDPDEVVEGYEGRLIAHKLLNHYILRVVYEEHKEDKIVITVYPAEKSRYWRPKE